MNRPAALLLLLVFMAFLLQGCPQQSQSDYVSKKIAEGESASVLGSIIKEWRILSIVFVLLSIGLISLAYPISSAFNMPELRAWADVELSEAFTTVLIVIAVMAVLIFVELVTQGILLNSPEFTCTPPGTYCPVSVAEQYLQGYLDATLDIYNDLMESAIKSGKLATMSVVFGTNYLWLGYASFSMKVVPEYMIDVTTMTQQMQFLMGMREALIYQQFLLSHISNSLAPMALLMGIIFRSFFVTRKLGGLLMAFGIGFLLVFPSSYALAFYTLQTTIYGASMTGGEVSTQFCTESCREMPPVAYNDNTNEPYTRSNLTRLFPQNAGESDEEYKWRIDAFIDGWKCTSVGGGATATTGGGGSTMTTGTLTPGMITGGRVVKDTGGTSGSTMTTGTLTPGMITGGTVVKDTGGTGGATATTGGSYQYTGVPGGEEAGVVICDEDHPCGTEETGGGYYTGVPGGEEAGVVICDEDHPCGTEETGGGGGGLGICLPADDVEEYSSVAGAKIISCADGEFAHYDQCPAMCRSLPYSNTNPDCAARYTEYNCREGVHRQCLVTRYADMGDPALQGLMPADNGTNCPLECRPMVGLKKRDCDIGYSFVYTGEEMLVKEIDAQMDDMGYTGEKVKERCVSSLGAISAAIYCKDDNNAQKALSVLGFEDLQEGGTAAWDEGCPNHCRWISTEGTMGAGCDLYCTKAPSNPLTIWKKAKAAYEANDLQGQIDAAQESCYMIVPAEALTDPKCIPCSYLIDPGFASYPPVHQRCDNLCGKAKMVGISKDPGRSNAVDGFDGPAETKSITKLVVPAVILPLLNLVLTFIFIRTLSPMLGGDVDIPGMVGMMK